MRPAPRRTAAPPPELQPLEIAGVRCCCNRTTLPKVHLRAVLLGGPLYEPSAARRFALLAELLTKDTAQHGAMEVAELIERIGGKFSASGGNNTLNLALELLPSDLELGMDLLANAARPLIRTHLPPSWRARLPV